MTDTTISPPVAQAGVSVSHHELNVNTLAERDRVAKVILAQRPLFPITLLGLIGRVSLINPAELPEQMAHVFLQWWLKLSILLPKA